MDIYVPGNWDVNDIFIFDEEWVDEEGNIDSEQVFANLLDFVECHLRVMETTLMMANQVVYDQGYVERYAYEHAED